MENEELVLLNIDLAKRLAKIKKRKKQISNVYLEELESAAYLALVEASKKFDKRYNASFATYAFVRINGAIEDYLREISWGSRKGFNKKPDLLQDFSLFDKEYASLSIDEFDIIISPLPQRSQEFLKLYYEENIGVDTISSKYKMSKSRVYKIINDALMVLRKTWDENLQLVA
jgi:RNA polymerase sigma factor (sigma-70 family)